MVLIGLDEMLSAYRAVNTYPHTLEEEVHKDPAELSVQEMHDAAWPRVNEMVAAEQTFAAERFEQQHGTGPRGGQPHTIEEAAPHKRVDTLLVATEPLCWEHHGR